MSVFNVSAITNYAKNNITPILGLILLGLDAVNKGQVQLYEDIKDETGLTTLKSGNLGAPFVQAFQPKVGAMSFSYRKLIPKRGKVDLEIHPMQFWNTWLKAVQKPGQDPLDMPYEEFFMAQIALKVADEINKQSVFFGVENGAGVTTTDIADGFKKIIADEIANLTPVVTGAITVSNAVAKVELLCAALSADHRKLAMNLNVSYEVYDFYCKNYRTLFGALPYNTDFEKSKVDGYSNVTLTPCSWMGSSQRMILTPAENLVMGTDLISDLDAIQMVVAIRALQIAMHYVLCYQIADLSVLYVNDQV